ncbi:hypothetical protein L596_018022 [Steinernema carpocapsae]|uniref:non-specific serine/threonine protein kinase n=1 Tax=Steinernema carpocapsae TaxID=34508 RepID=A0A4V6XW40_STECR|nr:hypothetical protein L596_018022 [Steinernema carpocapsae]
MAAMFHSLIPAFNNALHCSRRPSKRKSLEETSKAAKRTKPTPSPEEFCLQPHVFFLNRFFVLRKAGEGAFASVWVCWDAKLEDFVALKVTKTAGDFASAREELNAFRRLQKRHRSQPHVVALLDAFSCSVEGAKRMFLVFELMGATLLDRIHQRRGLVVTQIQRTLKDVLKGLRMLHDAEIVHTDLKPENILVEMSAKEKMTLAFETLQILKTVGRTHKDQERIRAYRCSLKNDLKKELRNKRRIVKIADLGSAFFVGNEDLKASVITTLPYRSFEALMGAEWGLKTDIWSVGCLAFELATARMLMPVGDQEDRKLLNFMICRLGMPPMALRRAGAHAATHFASNGGRRDKTELTKLSIKAEKILSEGRNFFSTRQAIEFCDFINKSLDFDVLRRPDAAACLDHDFLKNS